MACITNLICWLRLNDVKHYWIYTTNLSNDSHHIYVRKSPIELHEITSTLRLLLIICHKSVLLISTFRQWILYMLKCCGFLCLGRWISYSLWISWISIFSLRRIWVNFVDFVDLLFVNENHTVPAPLLLVQQSSSTMQAFTHRTVNPVDSTCFLFRHSSHVCCRCTLSFLSSWPKIAVFDYFEMYRDIPPKRPNFVLLWVSKS